LDKPAGADDQVDPPVVTERKVDDGAPIGWPADRGRGVQVTGGILRKDLKEGTPP
jgi:hypothetical protein